MNQELLRVIDGKHLQTGQSFKKIQNERNHAEYNITLNDIGQIKKAVYKIIRQQELHEAGKLHMFMRKIPNILSDFRQRNFCWIFRKIQWSLQTSMRVKRKMMPVTIKAIKK